MPRRKRDSTRCLVAWINRRNKRLRGFLAKDYPRHEVQDVCDMRNELRPQEYHWAVPMPGGVFGDTGRSNDAPSASITGETML